MIENGAILVAPFYLIFDLEIYSRFIVSITSRCIKYSSKSLKDKSVSFNVVFIISLVRIALLGI